MPKVAATKSANRKRAGEAVRFNSYVTSAALSVNSCRMSCLCCGGDGGGGLDYGGEED